MPNPYYDARKAQELSIALAKQITDHVEQNYPDADTANKIATTITIGTKLLARLIAAAALTVGKDPAEVILSCSLSLQKQVTNLQAQALLEEIELDLAKQEGGNDATIN